MTTHEYRIPVAERHQLRAKALAISRHSIEQRGRQCALVAVACGSGHRVLGLGFGAGVVLGEQALEHLAAGSGADGVADAVVLGEGLDFVEAVFQVEVLPAVGIADREVQLDVEAA